TRLTQSGLSITEWKPVMGVIPPLNDQDWQAEFQGYKAIPQYKELNRGMSLNQFKTIYWWEWTHRLLARSTGFVFLLPFLFFPWRGRLVDGLLRSRRHRAGERVAIPFGVSFDARGLDLCRRAVDRAANDPA